VTEIDQAEQLIRDAAGCTTEEAAAVMRSLMDSGWMPPPETAADQPEAAPELAPFDPEKPPAGRRRCCSR